MTKSRILMKIPRKVDMINDCIRPWSSIRVSKSLTILRSKKVMGKLMVLRRKSLTIPMLIRSDTYSIRRLWIKSDAIERNGNPSLFQPFYEISETSSPIFRTSCSRYGCRDIDRATFPFHIPIHCRFRLWIKSDAIELNAKIIPAISMVFTNWQLWAR